MATKKATNKTAAKASPGTAVVPSNGRSVVVGGWRERAAKSIQAGKKASAKLPAASGNFISFRGGNVSLGGASLPNPLPLVILSYEYERAYYSRPFQPDVIAAPDCYSYDGETPHEKSKVPQSDRCNGCRFNEFQTATNGKGKGCKEGVKFAAIHADALESPEKILGATIVQGRLSVLNSKAFRSYAGFFEDADRPLWTSVTHLDVKPDSKSQYAVTFSNSVADLNDDDLDAIATRVDEADKLLAQPYPDFDQAAPQAPAARGRAGAAPAGQPARRRKF